MDKLTYTIENLNFSYGSTHILKSISQTFNPGMVHAIIGPNGSGKSTLLDLMAGHKQPARGNVALNGQSVHEMASADLARLTAMIPQEFDFKFPFTVREAVLMGRHPHIPRFARPSTNDTAIVQKAMETMDISGLADRVLADLSGGEKQRTIFARGLAQQTPGLLLDEPTSSMDIRHALAAMAQLQKLAHEHGRTIVTVLHDLNLAATFCDRIIVLKHGEIKAQGRVDETLTPSVINDVFDVQAEVIHTKNGITISYGI